MSEASTTPIATLPDDAVVRIWPCLPAVTPDVAAAACAAIDKLLLQFVREGAVAAAGSGWMHDYRALVVAWQAPGAPLSGCRQDKLSKVLAHVSEVLGRDVRDAPPFVVAVGDQPTALDHAAFRAGVAEGVVTETTLAWNLQAADLGTWRHHGVAPIAAIDYLQLSWRKAKRCAAT